MTGLASPWPEAFDNHRAAGLALLMSGAPLNVRQAQFCGGLTATETDLSERQERWLSSLLKQHGLPPIRKGGQ